MIVDEADDGLDIDPEQIERDHQIHSFEPPWCALCGPPCRRTDDDNELCATCRRLVKRWS